MKVAEFLENFRYVAEAPNGVARLRELILQLAVSGQLVEQSSADGDVSEVLHDAFKEREKYLAKLSLRKKKLQGPVRDEEKSFQIPVTWEWARLEQLARAIASSFRNIRGL